MPRYTFNNMSNPPKILIVDDDNQIADLFITKLTNSHFAAARAYNGKEGYELAKKEKPDLILLDLKMPVMDGATTLEKLHADEKTKNIPVIILSSFNDWSAIKMSPETAKELGAIDFVEKGTDLNLLVQRIKGVLHLM